MSSKICDTDDELDAQHAKYLYVEVYRIKLHIADIFAKVLALATTNKMGRRVIHFLSSQLHSRLFHAGPPAQQLLLVLCFCPCPRSIIYTPTDTVMMMMMIVLKCFNFCELYRWF